MFHPETRFGVVSNEDWFSDSWSALEFGRGFDFQKKLFEQMKSLTDSVPHMARSALFNENSDFASNLSHCRNCYLIFNSTHCEDCMYGENLWRTKDSLDCSHLSECELCYDCLLCDNCYNLQSSWDCEGCSDSWFLLGCIGCRNCFGCVNLRHKEYVLYNRQVSPAEFKEFLGQMNLESRKERAVYAAEAEKVWRAGPRPHVTVKHCENVHGNYLFHSRDLENCFFIRDGESLANCSFLYGGARDCRDFTFVGLESELMYECAWCAINCRLCRFCFWCLQSQDLFYCWHCIGCRSCFACAGLRNQEYCICNKQYSRQEYELLVPRIIEHMQRTGEWGEFFPITMSPVPYNHSMAQRFFPLSKAAAEKLAYPWYDKPLVPASNAVPAERLPDVQPESEEPLVFTSQASGSAFRVTAEERRRCRLFRAPLPVKAYDERLTERALRLGGLELFPRRCAKTGAELLSNVPADSTWLVWNRDVYEAELR